MFSQPSASLSKPDYFHILNFKSLVLINQLREDSPYEREKPGGSDIGYITRLGEDSYILKTGISLSLLAQALKKPEKARMYLGFIVGNFTRITSDKFEHHPDLTNLLIAKNPGLTEKKIAEVLTDELFIAFQAFQETEAGKSMQLKDKLSTSDVYEIYHYLVKDNQVVRDIVGVAAFADVLYGAMGQLFTNSFHLYSGIPHRLIDNGRSFADNKSATKLFLFSRFIPKAEPFHEILIAPFINSSITAENTEEWLTKCEAVLLATLSNLRGLSAAIMIRHLMGESADLGPDNMLIVENEGLKQIINIDVTGFRYPRRAAFVDQRSQERRLGWEEILATDAADKLVELLLDKSVFSKRFLMDAKNIPADKDRAKILEVIIRVLKFTMIPHAAHEIEMVRNWLRMQDAEPTIRTLKSGAKDAFGCINPVLAPSKHYLDNIIGHASKFIEESICVANSMGIEQRAKLGQ